MKFVMLHGYSDSNKGDLAIVVASIHALRKLYPDAEIALQTVFPQEDPDFVFHHRFVTQLGITLGPMGIPSPYADTHQHSVSRNVSAMWSLVRNTLIQKLLYAWPALRSIFPAQAKSLDQLRSADIVLLKGGQYIYNDQGGLRGLLYLWRILYPIRVARQLGKPVVMLGQSVGPVLGVRAQSMVRDALAGCQRLMVREDLSAKLMETMGLKQITVIAPDMAFLTVPRKPSSTSEEITRLEQGQWLGVTVVNWNFPGSADAKSQRAAYEQTLANVCERAFHAFGVSIALFPQVTVRHHGESDLDMILRVEAVLRQRGVDVMSITDDLWPDEFSYLYGRCRALLGTRLHSCILAACAGCPVVAIRYQGYKTEGVMKGLGLEDFVHDINDVKEEPLLESVRQALLQRDEISERVLHRVSGYCEELMTITKTEVDQACAAPRK
jgi:polysaccharide pyruvyl transferase WcaK-like protein